MLIDFRCRASVSNEERARNAVTNAALGLPFHKGAGRLAVVGGGHSINRHVDELRNWDGCVWAVNGTINWCIDHGIDAGFYTIDASPLQDFMYQLDRVSRAVLSIECDPSLFGHFRNADISVLPPDEAGPTSAAGAGALGLVAGYRHITFFGCEGSFGETTHAFKNFDYPDWIVAKIGEGEFRTKPEFAEQSQVIAQIIRAAPDVFAEKSGGLLRAMVEAGEDYHICEMSPELLASIVPKEAA